MLINEGNLDPTLDDVFVYLTKKNWA
jgi:hypothetical protein